MDDKRLLNKFISRYCSKEMTSIDIDVCLLKMSKKHLRMIESKHITEGMSKGQRRLYETLVWMFKGLNRLFSDWKFEVMRIYGTPLIPEEDGDIYDVIYEEIIVRDLIKDEVFKITGVEKIIKFLEFEEYEKEQLNDESLKLITDKKDRT